MYLQPESERAMGLILSYAALVSLQCLQRCQLRYSRRTKFRKVQTILQKSELEPSVKEPQWRRTRPPGKGQAPETYFLPFSHPHFTSLLLFEDQNDTQKDSF